VGGQKTFEPAEMKKLCPVTVTSTEARLCASCIGNTIEPYSQLLLKAWRRAQRAYRLSNRDDFGLAETWRTFVLMVEQRREGAAYAVRGLSEGDPDRQHPPCRAGSVVSAQLKQQSDRLNSQFKKLAIRLNTKLGG
jgi:hypothetical protein